MSTYREAWKKAGERLRKSEVPDAETDAWYLLSFVTGLTRAEYFLKSDEMLLPEQEQQLEKLVEERSRRIPLQYLTGTQEFMGVSFMVTPATLIPRQDTEILVEEARKILQVEEARKVLQAKEASKMLLEEKTDARVLDLCTGTGCILLSLAKLCHLSRAVGTDLVQEALETAEKNAARLGVAAEFYMGDLFAALDGVKDARFDLIVSNPPYIRTGEIASLMPEVRDYEPVTALDGAADGLEFYRRIADSAPGYLAAGGHLMLEIGSDQAKDVSGLLLAHGFTELYVKQDYAGLDRVVCARWTDAGVR